MNYKFTLSTDSTCDLYRDFIVENDIKLVSLTFTVEGKDGVMQDRLDNFTQYSQYVDFYNELRSGAFARTSMLNYDAHLAHFLSLAQEGAEDVVHFTISSGLSPTKDVAAKAAEEVKKSYPKFKVWVVDPLTATVGQGSLVRIALKCRNEGKTAQQTYDFCNSLRPYIQHYIIANDLTYLHKGGRISAVSAAFGSLLNIKPVITFDMQGRLYNLAKVKGTKKAISFIKNKLLLDPPDPAINFMVIVHTDNEAPCAELAEFVKSTFGIQPIVSIMGPVIGSHVGPGAFALGYISKNERNKIK